MHFKAGGREVETIATDTVTQCSKNGKISVIQKSRIIPKKNYTNFSNILQHYEAPLYWVFYQTYHIMYLH